MKKLKFLLVTLMFIILPFTSVSAKEKINVYLFRGEGCPHCTEAEKFFDELSKDSEYSSYYNLKSYEVWYDENNEELMENVIEALDTTASGVPFIVIGDEYISGYSSDTGNTIKETIKIQYNSSDYKDIVKEIEDGSYSGITNDDSSNDEYDYSDDNNYDNKYDYDEDKVDQQIDNFFDRFESIATNFFNLEGTAFAGLFAAIFVYIFIVLSIVVVVQIFFIICKWKIYVKAGKNGWEALIPYYSSWTFFEISGYPGWIALIAIAEFIPYLGYAVSIAMFVFRILTSISLAKKFHKSEGFGVLLGLLPIIGLPILAFGSDTYDSSLGQQKTNSEDLEDEKDKSNNTKNKKYCSNCGSVVTKNAKYCNNCGEKI